MIHRHARMSRFAFCLSVLLVSQGCQPTEYHEGHPLPDESVGISRIHVDSIVDDAGRVGTRISYRVDWAISPGNRASRGFRLGFVHDSIPQQWFPSSRSIPITTDSGTAFDTLTCMSRPDRFPKIEVFVMASLMDSQYLAVASASIGHSDIRKAMP